MPIVFKGLSGWKLLDLLEIPPDDLAWLQQNSFVVTVYANEIRFSSAEMQAAIPVKLDTLSQLKAGTLSELGVKALRLGVKGAINQLKKISSPLTGGASLQPKPTVVVGTAAGFKAILDQNKPAQAPQPTSTASWPTFPLNKLTDTPPVPLAQATQMYQPVRGSSDESRYFLVAANKDLRIGCRYKGEGLSIRIEGPFIHSHHARLIETGFSGVKKNYASMHLSISDDVVARKALGAVLMGLGVQMDTPLPDLSLIYGKGV